MIQPITYGPEITYHSTDLSGFFNWTVPNNPYTVMEEIMSGMPSVFGAPPGSRTNTTISYDYPGSTMTNSTTFATASIVTSNHSSGGAYQGILSGPDGMLYMIPNSSGAYYIGQWNPYNSSFKELKTDLHLHSTYGSVMHPNGNIYSFPYQSDTTVWVTNIYSGTSTTLTYPNNNGCYGAVIDQFGMIWSGMYGFLGTGNPVKLNPYTNQFTSYASVGQNAYGSPVLTANGKIIWFPYSITNTADYIVTDPATGVSTSYVISSAMQTTFGGVGSGGSTFTFSGGVPAPNGLVYFIPLGSCPYVVEYNPFNNTFRTIGSSFSLNGRWGTGTLGPDGFIYAPPISSNMGGMLKIDWQTKQVYNLGGSLGGSSTFNGIANNWWNGSALHETGIYFAPSSFYSNGAMMLRLKFDGLRPNFQATLCREYNHF